MKKKNKNNKKRCIITGKLIGNKEVIVADIPTAILFLEKNGYSVKIPFFQTLGSGIIIVSERLLGVTNEK